MVGPCLCTRHDSNEVSNAVNSYQQNEISFTNISPKENAAAEAMQTLKAAVRNILRSIDVYKLNLQIVKRRKLVMKAFIYVAHSWYCILLLRLFTPYTPYNFIIPYNSPPDNNINI